MSDFLPENYKDPSEVSNYLKLEDGDTVIRILSKPVMGWEIWETYKDDKGEEKKRPLRFRDMKDQKDDIPVEVMDLETDDNKLTFFWALVVWNHDISKVQIFEIKQATIRKGIKKYSRMKAWGNPIGENGYDITINRERTGSGRRDVEYLVAPNPQTKLDKEVMEKYKSMKIDLDLLFEGEDPFNPDKITDKDIEAIEAS